MPRNIEIKARVSDLSATRRAAIAIGAKEHDSPAQTDTYFHVEHGRLKLREVAGKPAQLIWYSRADENEPRPSDFTIVQIDDPAALMRVLAGALGVRGSVRKNREVLLWENVRIHLDIVEELGTFIELEAVVADGNEDISRERVRHLMMELGIHQEDLECRSYGDLRDSAGI